MIATEAARERKARGAFYTPVEIARYLADWAITLETRRVLEPSAGDGVFVEAAARRSTAIGRTPEVVGIELVASEAAIARQRASQFGLAADIRVGDFFSYGPTELGTFDAVIGNPPWIRYHGFTGQHRTRALARASAAGVELGGLASSWAPYVVHACSLLSPGGRLGLVLPAELLQVDYAVDLRRYLGERFASLQLVAFERRVFGDAEVDAVLILGSPDGPPGVSFERVRSLKEVGTAPIRVGTTARWTNAIANDDALAVLDTLETDGRLIRLGLLGSVDIGVVTGYNDYFLLSAPEAEAFGVPASNLRPCVSRSGQLADGVVSAAHFDAWRTGGKKVSLLALDRGEPNGTGRYLAEGIRLGVPRRYKCRMRRPWYAVPLKAPPDLFLSYMAHETPRLAWNQVGALSTNLLHGVYLRDRSQAESVAGAWHNPATALSAELEGRTYGGGVLKLETKEAERVLVPPSALPLVLSDVELAILNRALAERRSQRMHRTRVRTARAQ